ncbi:MAG: hypothetical protein LBB75_02260 [Oscillospiraceae bacterium]|jgi:hypothetical protein|nr:hypothetical protein [Oscillospiraceae bacterium]
MNYLRRLVKRITLLTITTVILCAMVFGANAAVGDGANRFNVVFVSLSSQKSNLGA